MSIHVRNKGHSGEREICHMLNAYFRSTNRVVNRNVDQVRDGGADIIDVEPFAIEVKRQERLLLKQWWKQATEQVTRKNPIPMLVYRKNRQKWKVIIPAELILKKRYKPIRADSNKSDLGLTLEISWDLFLVVLGTEIARLGG